MEALLKLILQRNCFSFNDKYYLQTTSVAMGQKYAPELCDIGESWGMANDGEWRTGRYLVEGVKVIKCFHPRMLTPPMARVNTK